MEGKGRIVRITYNFANKHKQITFEFDNVSNAAIEEIKDKDLSITIKQLRQKRSLDANKYYWTLITKLADKMEVSNAYMHNIILRRYGQFEDIDGKLVYLVLPDGEKGEMKALEAETYHIKPTSQVKAGADGLMYRTYIMLRGSSTYDTKEMSRLISGLIEDCKEQGIDTMPPDEFKRMMDIYEQNHRKKVQSHEISVTG
ncbi:hypothetical protein QE152_g39966 [Popillia japonica]|uniref:Uncharacterized protein n=1 Tax=Popillia japonica TaxID=7064 RepID=A0AAW1HT78_POPJA